MTSTSPIDFGPFLHGYDQDRVVIAAAIDTAFRDYGFACLSNHGIEGSEIESCLSWSKRFFDLPADIKGLAPHPPGGNHHRGWSGLGTEKVTQNIFDEEAVQALRQVPDVKESFESGNVNDDEQPNIWLPEDEIPGFRRVMESFFLKCEALVHQVLVALAYALRLKDTKFFSDKHSRSLFQLRILHYPAVAAKVIIEGQKSRISAHSDFGTLTLVFQDSIGGLEIESPREAGHFQPVKPTPGAVVVHVGDLMERWTNGYYKATLHRVVAPPARASEDQSYGDVICPPRYSIPFFATVNPDVMIEALPGTWNESDRPKRYVPICASDYVQMRMQALYHGSAT